MKVLKQLFIIFSICLFSEIISGLLPIVFPSGVISLVLLLLLFISKAIKPEGLKETAEFLLANMAFFFIPSGVGIMEKYGLLKDSIVQLLIICLLITFLTFGVTAFTVTYVIRLMDRKGGGKGE